MNEYAFSDEVAPAQIALIIPEIVTIKGKPGTLQ